MHEQVLAWVAERRPVTPNLDVLDIGGRDLNGTARHLFADAQSYVCLDLYEGPGVDIVGDATSWRTDDRFDVVLCLEVFEHLQAWRAIVATAFAHLVPGGVFICTAAGPGRPAHGGIQLDVQPDEWYENIEPAWLADVLAEHGEAVEVRVVGLDVQGVARKPREA